MKRKINFCLFVLPALVILPAGCIGFPKGAEPVRGFELARYLGKWYEIARLDHSFERGLSRVTAEYSLREDGGLRVINRGFSAADNAWREAEGRAYFVEDPDLAHLKVSFFGPFYGTYAVFELDRENYAYAFIAGYDTSYLWLLSRTPSVDEGLLNRFRERARLAGFDTEKLIFVEQ